MVSDLPNIRHLHAFAAVMNQGSITAAARSVNLTQPALTQAIFKMEGALGAALFERRADGMTPTAAARVWLPRVEMALRLIGTRRATVAQIRAFLAVARHGGYAAAAAAIGLSEASLHRAVADLSIGLGHRLIERRGRAIGLTARGTAVARNFRLAVAELRSAQTELSALAGKAAGRITIGAMPLSRARLLPAAVMRFHFEHPDIDLAIIEGSHAELLSPLRDGDIDLMIGALRTEVAEGLVQCPLFEDRPVIVARQGHPLTAQSPFDAQKLQYYPWIVSAPGTPLRREWMSMFDALGVAPPRVPIECGSVLMLRQMLMRDDFLTLLSPDQILLEIEAGWLTKLGEPPGSIRRTIGMTTRRDWRPTPAQQALIGIISEEARQIGRTIHS
ncbi:MAG: LysR family transcriptional regulator [Sphingomonadaceae bacterium]